MDQINLPEPLVPAEVDLSDFKYMELDVQKLRDSKFAAEVEPEAFRAGVLLWCAAWHQIPAGSLPDNDKELSILAGFGRVLKEWRKVREEALSLFVKCSDGRLYHKVIAEKAVSAWDAKLVHQYEKLCDRMRKENKKRKDQGLDELPVPGLDQWKASGRSLEFQTLPPQISVRVPPEKPPPSAGNPPENSLKGNGTERNGEGTERNGTETLFSSEPVGSVSADASKPKPLRPGKNEPKSEPPTRETWEAFTEAYRHRYGIEPVRNQTVNSLMSQFVKRIGREEAPMVAAWFVRSNRGFYVSQKHPVGAMLKDAEGLRTEWATGRGVTETAARQTDQTASRLSAFQPILEEATARAQGEGGGENGDT